MVIVVGAGGGSSKHTKVDGVGEHPAEDIIEAQVEGSMLEPAAVASALQLPSEPLPHVPPEFP